MRFLIVASLVAVLCFSAVDSHPRHRFGSRLRDRLHELRRNIIDFFREQDPVTALENTINAVAGRLEQSLSTWKLQQLETALEELEKGLEEIKREIDSRTEADRQFFFGRRRRFWWDQIVRTTTMAAPSTGLQQRLNNIVALLRQILDGPFDGCLGGVFRIARRLAFTLYYVQRYPFYTISNFGDLIVAIRVDIQECTPTTTTEAAAEDATTEAAAEDAPTEAPAEDATTEAAAEDATTEAPTEDATTEAPTENATTEPAAEDATTEAPAEEATTEAPAEDATTEAAAEDATTEAQAEEATTEAPAEDATTEAPAEDATTEAPTEDATTLCVQTATEVFRNGIIVPSFTVSVCQTSTGCTCPEGSFCSYTIPTVGLPECVANAGCECYDFSQIANL